MAETNGRRVPRLRPIPAEVIEGAAARAEGTSDAELLDRLETALASLPPEERAAAVVAFGYDEGSDGVAEELNLPPREAAALASSALQLLRGALDDLEPEDGDRFLRLVGRRRIPRDPPS